LALCRSAYVPKLQTIESASRRETRQDILTANLTKKRPNKGKDKDWGKDKKNQNAGSFLVVFDTQSPKVFFFRGCFGVMLFVFTPGFVFIRAFIRSCFGVLLFVFTPRFCFYSSLYSVFSYVYCQGEIVIIFSPWQPPAFLSA
jgi:hypothetical protein